MANPTNGKSFPVYDEVSISPYHSSPLSPNTTEPERFINDKNHPETPLPPGKYRDSVLLIISQWRGYVRVVALLVVAISFTLTLVGLISYEKRESSGPKEIIDPYTGNEIYVEITTRPNVTFATIGGVNTILSALLLLLCWRSNKISHANNITNAIVCIIAFTGFASTMSACVYLQQNTKLRTTLWEWACDTSWGSSDPRLDYYKICNVIRVSWVFGLVQAVLDLVTVVLSFLVFSLVKWRLFSRYGSPGRIF